MTDTTEFWTGEEKSVLYENRKYFEEMIIHLELHNYFVANQADI